MCVVFQRMDGVPGICVFVSYISGCVFVSSYAIIILMSTNDI